MPFLNKVARSPPSRMLLVSLPAGTVFRGRGLLSIPVGLSITLQGRGKDGAGNTTLDLQRQNLFLGAMLGDTGRMEFSGMHITNVRPLRAAVRAVCDVAVCAGSFGIPLPDCIGGLRLTLVQCRFGSFVVGFVALFGRFGCFLSALRLLRPDALTRMQSTRTAPMPVRMPLTTLRIKSDAGCGDERERARMLRS